MAGASEGEGLGNQFLANIRTCDAIAHVVRAFEDNNIQHVDNTPDPKKDIDVINTELVLADLQSVQKRLPKLHKEARANPKLQPMVDALTQIQSLLDEGKPLFELSNVIASELWAEIQKDLQLITMKKTIYVFNVDEETLQNQAKKEQLANIVTPSQAVFICAELESELKSLDEAERSELLSSYGQKESGLNQLINSAYDVLGLQSYLTAGEKEVRAWTIKKGSTAPQAAGVIHGDFEKGFIAAQIVNYHDLISAGSEQAAKAAGKLRTEGKTYIMQPDDVVEFKFNN